MISSLSKVLKLTNGKRISFKIYITFVQCFLVFLYYENKMCFILNIHSGTTLLE